MFDMLRGMEIRYNVCNEEQRLVFGIFLELRLPAEGFKGSFIKRLA